MRNIIPTVVAAVLCVACTTSSGVSQVDRIPTDMTNTNYYSNVAPLIPQQMQVLHSHFRKIVLQLTAGIQRFRLLKAL